MHNFGICWISLYMFRTFFPSIIRSPRLYKQRQVYVIQVLWLHTSRSASKQSTDLYDIYLTLYVQSWTPDDWRKEHPKHIEWCSANSKIVHLVGFTIEIKYFCFCIRLENIFSYTKDGSIVWRYLRPRYWRIFEEREREREGMTWRWKKLCARELYKFYFSPNTRKMINVRRLR
jgi:hypothetical protein